MSSLNIEDTKGLPVDWLLYGSADAPRTAAVPHTRSPWTGTADFIVQVSNCVVSRGARSQ